MSNKRRIYFLVGVVLIVIGFVLIYIESTILKTGWINPFLSVLVILIGIVSLGMSKPSLKMLTHRR